MSIHYGLIAMLCFPAKTMSPVDNQDKKAQLQTILLNTRARARTQTHTRARARALAHSRITHSLSHSLSRTHARTHAYTHNQNWGRCRHYQHSISVNTLTLSATCNTYIRTMTFAVDTSTGSPRSRLFVIRWCQLSAPDNITTSSPGNTLRVVFSSDWSVTYQGFSASYIAYDPYSGESYVDWSVHCKAFPLHETAMRD